jgi:hypothetical protein
MARTSAVATTSSSSSAAIHRSEEVTHTTTIGSQWVHVPLSFVDPIILFPDLVLLIDPRGKPHHHGWGRDRVRVQWLRAHHTTN